MINYRDIVVQAENHLFAARSLLLLDERFLRSILIFSHFCAKDALKAYLIYQNVEYISCRTLHRLFDRCSLLENEFLDIKDSVEMLAPFTEEIGYPSSLLTIPNASMTQDSIEHATHILEYVTLRTSLPRSKKILPMVEPSQVNHHENDALLERCINIEDVKQKLIQTYNPHAIYIFGSYAWGTPTADSDLDILIVVNNLSKGRHQYLVEGYLALSELSIDKDIVLYTKEEFDERATHHITLCYKVKHEGKQIYAR